MSFAESAADILTDPNKQMKLAAEVGNEDEEKSEEERARNRRMKAILYTLAGLTGVGLGSYFLLRHPEVVSETSKRIFGGGDEEEPTTLERAAEIAGAPEVLAGLGYLGAGTRRGASILPRTLQRFPFLVGDRAVSPENLRKHLAEISTPAGEEAAAKATSPDQRLTGLASDIPDIAKRQKLRTELERSQRGRSILNLIAADPRARVTEKADIDRFREPRRVIPGLSGIGDVGFMRKLEKGLAELETQKGRTPGVGERTRALTQATGLSPAELRSALTSYRQARVPRGFWRSAGRFAAPGALMAAPAAIETYKAWTD